MVSPVCTVDALARMLLVPGALYRRIDMSALNQPESRRSQSASAGAPELEDRVDPHPDHLQRLEVLRRAVLDDRLLGLTRRLAESRRRHQRRASEERPARVAPGRRQLLDDLQALVEARRA